MENIFRAFISSPFLEWLRLPVKRTHGHGCVYLLCLLTCVMQFCCDNQWLMTYKNSCCKPPIYPDRIRKWKRNIASL